MLRSLEAKRLRGLDAERLKGFTLIEVLIALTAFSVILSLLYMSLSSSLDAMQRTETTATSLQEVRHVLDTLRREIESALYSPGNDQTFFRFMQRDLYGRDAAELEFTTLSTTGRGIFVVAYRVEEQAGKMILSKRIIPLNHSPETYEWEPIIEGLHSFSLKIQSKGELIKSWDTKLNQSLPEEVGLSIALMPSEDRPSSRPLVFSELVRLRIGRELK